MYDTITIEQVARHYSACLDSVKVILDDKSDEDAIKRNVDHLNIMLAKDFWTDAEDLTTLRDAVDSVS